MGGSDSHLADGIYGDPATYIYASSRSKQALVEGLKKGRVFFSRLIRPQIKIYTKAGEVMPGACLETFNGLTSIKINVQLKKITFLS